MAQHVDGGFDLLHAGDRQDQRLGADGHDHRVIALNSFGGGPGVQLDLDAALVYLGNQPVHVILDRIFEGEVARLVEHAAQLAGGLKQGDLMPPLLGHQGGLHAGGAAAHHGHLLDALHRLHQMGNGVLQPGGGVDGALEVMAVDGGVVAAHALDAGGDVLPRPATHFLMSRGSAIRLRAMVTMSALPASRISSAEFTGLMAPRVTMGTWNLPDFLKASAT